MGPHGDDRPAARGGRLRRARPGAVAPQAHAVVARVRRRGVGVGGRREPTRERAVVGGVRRRRAHRGRHRPAGARGAAAHPLGWALGRDRPADLQAAADALAERADTTQLSGAETLRLALGIEGSPLAGGVSVVGGGWAADLLAAAADVSSAPAGTPAGFVGELRSYQAEALAWLGFLGKAGLGGCLALDMGLGKTPTMLADLLAGAGSGPALVIAPPAVVGNWTAEAARFTPGLRVVVHHGANRAAADEIAAEVADADVVVTTYGTAVRDIDAIAAVSWSKVVLDEAQAIKNPANDTSQQLRRIPASTRIALTGTPIENGLGDLWAILDFANPGLVGPRPQFIARLSSDGRAARVEAEDAMRALNGILVFRRTKAEPDDRGGASRPDRRARPLRDDARADRSVPGAARHAGHRRRASRRRARPATARSSPRSPRSSRSATTPPRTRTTTFRSRVGRASSRASRRSSTRCSRRARACSCSRTSRSGACGSPSTSRSAPERRSRVTTAASRARRAIRSSPTSRAATGRASSSCR